MSKGLTGLCIREAATKHNVSDTGYCYNCNESVSAKLQMFGWTRKWE